MIVVSGCPRSGTSLIMLLHKEALGEERIIGEEWPMDIKFGNKNKQACFDYIRNKTNPDYLKHLEETKQMNPNGFWECPWTVRGIQYTANTPEENKVCKIVSQGLAASNPAYIDKIVMMVRHPFSVANSQKDLVLPIPVHSRNKDLGNISPQMFINVTVAASNWISHHKPKLLLVEFEELIADPNAQLARVEEFVGDGDWTKAKQQIKPKLQRNKPQRPNDKEEWDDALHLYDLFKAGLFESVVEWDKGRHKKKKQDNVQFYCPRFGGNTNSMMCTQCKTDKKIGGKFKAQAIKRKIDWENEPCLWECGMNPSKEYTPLTIDQSIKQNHWKNTKPDTKQGCPSCKRKKKDIRKY